MLPRRLKWLLLFCSALGAGAYAQPADPLAQARAELGNGRADAAYATLSPLEDERAGDPEFDYLLGLAALESGQASRASLIFERVLAVRPEHAGARLDLGRSYYALGAYARAQEEFDAVRALNPPPEALQTIAAHEAAMRSPPPAEPRFGAWAEASLGRDSNVNQATSAGTIYLPVFQGSFALSDNGRERADNYRAATAGARYGHPLGEALTLLASAEVRARRHAEADAYDSTSLDGTVGLRWADASQAAQLLASRGSYRLAGEAYRNTMALAADWRRGYGGAGALDVFAQFHVVRYVDSDLSSNDVNLALGGAGWIVPYAGANGQAYAAAFGGIERAVEGRVDGDKKILGLRAGIQQRVASFDFGSGASAQRGRYADENPLFIDTRTDRQYDLNLSADWRFAPAWSLRLSAALTRNDSNFAVYDYHRRDVSFGVRYDFR